MTALQRRLLNDIHICNRVILGGKQHYNIVLHLNLLPNQDIKVIYDLFGTLIGLPWWIRGRGEGDL